MPTVSLRNNDAMPLLGLGTWKSSPNEAYTSVKTALRTGYRHLDCAPVYGNEPEVGRALAESIAEGVVARDDVWIVSKLWTDSHAPEDVRPCLQRTLEDLRVDVVDLYMIHWPVAQHPQETPHIAASADALIPLEERPLAETWAALEALVDDGHVRHLGVSNFSVAKWQAIRDVARIPPEVNQVEAHPYLQQRDLLAYAQANDLHVTAYSSLGAPDRPPEMKQDDEPVLLDDPTVAAIAERHDASPARVLLAWALDHGLSVIPKAVQPEHIAENHRAFDLTLSDADHEALAALDGGHRYIDGSFWAMEGSPYSVAGIWDED